MLCQILNIPGDELGEILDPAGQEGLAVLCHPMDPSLQCHLWLPPLGEVWKTELNM